MPARATCWLVVFIAKTAPRNARPRGHVPLAAIDRMKWEQELRNRPQGDGQLWGTAPVDPSSIPSIWDAPENLASLEGDPALCFSVQYLR